MLTKKFLLYLMTVGLLSVGIDPIVAQTLTDSSANSNDPIAHVSFKAPPDEGTPDKTLGAGSRQDDLCSQDLILDKPAFMAVVPTNNYGLTFAERPTFFVYLPETSARKMVLSIKEEGTKHHSQTLLSITQTPGVIGIKASEQSPPLEVGKTYQWSVVLVCGEKPGPDDPSIASWIRRVASPALELDQKTALEQAVWYGEQGIWYDTLTVLVQARQAQPDIKVLTDIWAEFLNSVGLEAISNEPLAPGINPSVSATSAR